MFNSNNEYTILEIHRQRIAETERKAEKRRLLDNTLPKRVRRRNIHLNRPER